MSYSVKMRMGPGPLGVKHYRVDNRTAIEALRRIERAKSFREVKQVVMSSWRAQAINPDAVRGFHGKDKAEKTLAQILAEVALAHDSHEIKSGDLVTVAAAAVDKWAAICDKIEQRAKRSSDRRAASRVLRDFLINRIGEAKSVDVVLENVLNDKVLSDPIAKKVLGSARAKFLAYLVEEKNRGRPGKLPPPNPLLSGELK